MFCKNEKLKKAVEILIERFNFLKNQGERPYYVWHAVYLWVFRDIIDWEKSVPDSDQKEMFSTFERVKSQILENSKVKVDDFVLDMHTGSNGRSDKDM